MKDDSNVTNVTLLYMPDINNTKIEILLILVSYVELLQMPHMALGTHIETVNSENAIDTFCQCCNNEYGDESLLDRHIRRYQAYQEVSM